MVGRIKDYNPYLGYKDEFIQENIKLAYKVANKYKSAVRHSSHINFEDVISEAKIGLIKAFHNYDPSKFDGMVTKFSTYAFPMIMGEIQRFLRDKGTSLKIPRSLHFLVRQIIQNELLDLPASDIAKELRCEVNKAELALKYLHDSKIVYVDQAINLDEGEASILDTIGKEQDLTQSHVSDFLNMLNPKEKEIMLLRMGDLTQNEIATEIGKSQVQVSRVQKRIGKKLKKFMEAEGDVLKMKDEVTTRQVTKEEAKKHGIKLVTDNLEWFLDENLPSNPTVGITGNGISFNALSVKKLKCETGNFIKIGFNPESERLVLVKNEDGIKLRKASGGNGSIVMNKRLANWLKQKNVLQKRYVLEYDETAEVNYIQLEMA
jgi:RNA polymerase sigma factor (sigma-70 family)